MRRLVADGEAEKPDSQGIWHGLEIFQTDEGFELVVHSSMYTGIQRTSHHASPPIKLEATTLDEACDEGRRKVAAYARAVTGGSGDVE